MTISAGIINAIVLPIVIGRWVFILWMLWLIARSLRRIEASLRDLAKRP